MPLSETMSILAHELRMLTDSANELQDAIGDVIASAGPTAASSPIYALQNFDRICQSIAAVADFVDGLGQQANPEWLIDAQRAATEIKLSGLASRLTGKPEVEDDTDVFAGFDDLAAAG